MYFIFIFFKQVKDWGDDSDEDDDDDNYQEGERKIFLFQYNFKAIFF